MRQRPFFHQKIGGQARRTARRDPGGLPMRMLQRANMGQIMPERRRYRAVQQDHKQREARPFDMRTQRKHVFRISGAKRASMGWAGAATADYTDIFDDAHCFKVPEPP